MDHCTKRLVWQERIADLRRSRLSVKTWCVQQGLDPSLARYWVARLWELGDGLAEATSKDGEGSAGVAGLNSNSPDPGSTGPDWLPIDFGETQCQSSVSSRIVLRMGNASIEVEPGFDPALLRSVIQALEVQPC